MATRDERILADGLTTDARIAALRDAFEGVHFWAGTCELVPALEALIAEANNWLRTLEAET